MRKIRISKIEIVELVTLQTELLNYVTYNNAVVTRHKNSDLYFSIILKIDIAQNLVYAFRRTIENQKGCIANLNLSAADACILLEVCTKNSPFRNEFEAYTLQKFVTVLHKELTNLT